MSSMNKSKLAGCWAAAAAWLLCGLMFTGCRSVSSDTQFSDVALAAASTNSPAVEARTNSVNTGVDVLKIGDSLNIVFSDLKEPIPGFSEHIKDDGTITLMYNKSFIAAGKTRGQLEKEVRDAYVPSVFVNMTVTISPQERVFYVGGEVRSPGRQVFSNPITVLKAIQSAGDFNDFAQKRKVRLTRANGDKKTIDAIKARQHPELDLPVFPGDTIHVPRRFW